MARKRANNEGSITHRADRKRWEGRLTVGHKADGTPIRRTVTGRTRTEVIERLEGLRRAEEAGPGLPPEVTVARWCDHWLNEVLPLGHVARTTQDHYERMIRLYVVPYIGRVRVDQLSPAHVRGMLKSLRDGGLSPATQRLARSCLRAALQVAVADSLIPNNPAALVAGVRSERREGRTLTPVQARQLLQHVEGHRYEALITLMLALGLRRGEALALSWRDLDRDRDPATLTIRRALKRAPNDSLYLDEPKTTGSRRAVHLPAPLVRTLDQHRAQQAQERLAFGPGWGGDWAPHDLMFTTTIGTAIHPRNFARELANVTIAAGVGRWTPHELRHSAASLLLARNVPLKTISELLGHSSIRITADVYSHLLAPARSEAADAMADVLWGNSSR